MLRFLVFLFLFLAPVTSTVARETGMVRLGDHGTFVRVVIETPTPIQISVAIDPDAMAATVTAGAPLDFALPTKMTGSIASIEKLGTNGASSGLVVHFRTPVELSSRSTIPPEAGIGQRFVLDFQPMGAGAGTSPATPPPIPAVPKLAPTPPVVAAPPPSAKTPTFILAGFRSADFGASRDGVLAAIGKDFGEAVQHAATERDMDSQHLVVIVPPPLLLNTPPATITYVIDASPRGLNRITVAWSGGDGKGLTEAEAAQITAPTMRAFKTIDFSPGNASLGTKMSNGSVVVFEGIDAEGNMTRLTTTPVKLAAESSEKRLLVELTYAAGVAPKSH